MTISFTPPLRAGLEGFAPYGAPQVEAPNLLNVNENPYPPSEAFVAAVASAVAEAARGMNRYPDREFLDLRDDLADFLAAESDIPRLDSHRIWAANGSNELMLHLFQAFGGPGRIGLGFAPTYSMYPEYARDALTEWRIAPRGPAPDFDLDVRDVLTAIADQKPNIVILTSPNNPTGTALDLDLVEAAATALRAAEPRGILVVDEAYAEFRRDGVASSLCLLDRHPNLVVSRTMSKAFALAGARVGYLAASPGIVDALRIVRLPYHLSAVTQAVARAALAHRTELMSQVGALRDERDRTSAWLTAHGYDVAPSDANFVLFGTFEDRHAVFSGLLDRGVLIRETGPAGWLRVSIGTPAEMTAFRTALTEVDPR